MESGGDQAMGTPGEKKGGPPPADPPANNRPRTISHEESPPFNTSTVAAPIHPLGGQLPRMLYPGLRNSQGAIIRYPW